MQSELQESEPNEQNENEIENCRWIVKDENNEQECQRCISNHRYDQESDACIPLTWEQVFRQFIILMISIFIFVMFLQTVSQLCFDSMPKILADFLQKHSIYPASFDLNHLDSECPICLNEQTEEMQIFELPNCNHTFHTDCMKILIKQGTTICPVCRNDFTELITNEYRNY